MIKTQYVSWVITGLCVLGMSSPLFATCTTDLDCNDGKQCTLDLCSSGSCVLIPVDGFCVDDLFCNGVEVCAPATGHPITGCANGTDPCAPLTCAEATDECHCTSDADCDDGLFCTGVETCVNDQCVAGTPPDCDDGFSCTDDSCNEQTNQCENTPDDAACSDDDFCNGVEVCAPATGDPVTGCEDGVPPCDDGDGCTVDTCTEEDHTCSSVFNCDDEIDCTVDSCNTQENECEHAPDDQFCIDADGQFCNGDETCDPETGCQPAVPAFHDCSEGVPSCVFSGCDPVNNECSYALDHSACSDNKECTIDVCDFDAGCLHTPNDALCDNGLICDGTEFCQPNLGDPVTGCVVGVPLCSDTFDCTEDTCDEISGTCSFPIDCPDGSECTVNTCTTSGCDYDPKDTNCDDNISCTLDICDELTGCDYFPVNAACPDDGLFCNGVESCDPSAGCVSGPAPCGGQSCDEVTETCGGCIDNSGCSPFTPVCCFGVCRGCCTDSDCVGTSTCENGFCASDPVERF